MGINELSDGKVKLDPLTILESVTQPEGLGLTRFLIDNL